MAKHSRASQSRGSKGEAHQTVVPVPAAPPAPKASKLLTELRVDGYQGPLPPPQLLAQFNEVVPGCAEKIINQFVKQGNHRMDLERTVIFGGDRRAYLGLVAGFVLSLGALGASILLVLNNHGWEGVALGGIDIAALAGVFVYGTAVRQQEREKKTERTHRR